MATDASAPVASMDDLGSRLERGLDIPEDEYDYDKSEEREELCETGSKYKRAMQTLKPFRKRDREKFPLSEAGLFSYMTFHWLTGFVWGVYKKGTVDPDRVWDSPEEDAARLNGKRFERLWQEELQHRGVEHSSVFRVMLRFIRTRVIVSFLVQIGTLTFGLIGPAFMVKAILEYNRDQLDDRLWYGLALVLAFCLSELFKCIFFVTQWQLNYQTAMRLRGGVLKVIYEKILRLRSLKDKTVGQFVNIFVNDGQRLVEACSTGPLVIGGPLVAIVATIYCCWLLSAWALVGTCVFALFYPYQYLIARLTTYFRRLGIQTTDKRVRKMMEILTSIKLIKLYAWEKAFSHQISGIRKKEKKVLEKAAYVNTMSIAFLPMVPVFASVLTFICHTMAGNDLSPAQAFVVVAMYGGPIRQTMSCIPQVVRSLSDTAVSCQRYKAFSVMAVYFMMRQRVLSPLTATTKSLSEVLVGSRRMKAILIMEEREAISNKVSSQSNAVEIVDATFAWDAVQKADDSEVTKEKTEKKTEKKEKSKSKTRRGSNATSAKSRNAHILKQNKHCVENSQRNGVKSKDTGSDGGHVISDVSQVESDGGHIGSDSDNVGSDVNHVGNDVSQVESDGGHIGTEGNNVGSDGGHIESDRGHIASDEGHIASDEGHIASDEGHIASDDAGSHEWERLANELSDAKVNESEEEFVDTLFNINLAVPKGHLYGVCGAVGSGKSSLLAAILNEMVKRRGHVGVSGSLAYVPQQAWIMNRTLQENIIFGQEYDQERYAEALDRCNLLPDLEMLPGGDLTEIGERGINLSGGQKQRVSLARAVYCDRDVYLLDDPLSAVDPHVGQYLFENCIRGVLEDKTVIFVTHQLQYLNQCDQILYMKEGSIEEQGTHTELMALRGEYAALIEKFHSEHAQKDRLSESPSQPALKKVDTMAVMAARKASLALSGGEKLIEKEKVEKGEVTRSTYLAYFRAAGGLCMLPLVLFTFALPVSAAAFSNWWLSYWIAQGNGQEESDVMNVNDTLRIDSASQADDNLSDNPRLVFYVTVYGLTIILVVVTMCLRGFLYMKITLNASSKLHDQVFAKVVRSPMSFFDTTPVGRILNRFSKDLDDVDTKLPVRGESLLQNSMLVVTSLIVVAVVFPLFLLVVIPIAAIFLFLYRTFRVVLREVKRADSVSRSPWISHIATTVQGLHTIHAYNSETEFTHEFEELTDENSMLYFLVYYVMRWLALRLDFLAVAITTVTSVFVVVTKGNVDAAYAGLAIAYAAQISAMFQVTIRLLVLFQTTFTSVERIHSYIELTGMFQFTVRLLCEIEAQFSSVERIHYFIEFVDTEAPAVIENNRPAANWPSNGAITYRDVELRYRAGLPLVLRGVECDIRPREKVGIVGRTGSGKSSLGVALFRLVEPSRGTILIDDLDIMKIGLEDLRSQLSIIPQDPVLFVGTVRYNLDPFDEHPDSELWQALDKCHLRDVISGLEAQLHAPVLENGENFSVGERQLMCMARALLRHSKILMLDEATAAIDTETDAKIQTTIQEAFRDCTLLTIAHRLNTVLSCDRILVLQDGKICEFDTPEELMADKESKFYSMMTASDMPALQ